MVKWPPSVTSQSEVLRVLVEEAVVIVAIVCVRVLDLALGLAKHRCGFPRLIVSMSAVAPRPITASRVVKVSW